MIKILCIGDSLSLPRQGCCYEDTWVAKLKAKYSTVDFVCNFKGGMLIEDALHYWSNYYQNSRFEIAIIQEGICDCSPRYINDKRLVWKIIIGACKKLKLTKAFWSFVKKRPRSVNCVYTSPSLFAFQYESMVRSMLETIRYIIIVKIGHGTEAVVARSTHFNDNVNQYNSILDDIQKKYSDRVIVVDPLAMVDDSLFVDGYHCNREGMNNVFLSIDRMLKQILSTR